MSLYEAKACGSLIVTTNMEPMNLVGTKYLVEPSEIKEDKTLVPYAHITVGSIHSQLRRVCEDSNVEQH